MCDVLALACMANNDVQPSPRHSYADLYIVRQEGYHNGLVLMMVIMAMNGRLFLAITKM